MAGPPGLKACPDSTQQLLPTRRVTPPGWLCLSGARFPHLYSGIITEPAPQGGARPRLTHPSRNAQHQHEARVRGSMWPPLRLPDVCLSRRRRQTPPRSPHCSWRAALTSAPLLGASSLHREKTLQDAGLTYQQFKNCRDNLSSWLEHLPHNQVRPRDGPSQIAYKLQAQKVWGWGCRRLGVRPGPCPEPRPPALAASSAGRAACARVAP